MSNSLSSSKHLKHGAKSCVLYRVMSRSLKFTSCEVFSHIPKALMTCMEGTAESPTSHFSWAKILIRQGALLHRLKHLLKIWVFDLAYFFSHAKKKTCKDEKRILFKSSLNQQVSLGFPRDTFFYTEGDSAAQSSCVCLAGPNSRSIQWVGKITAAFYYSLAFTRA